MFKYGLGDVDWFVPLPPHHHLHLSHSQPSDETGDNSLSSTEWDHVGYISQVGFKACRDVNGSQSSLELVDFEVSEGNLRLQLLFVDPGLVKFLASGQGVVADGGNESEGNGMDGIVDVRMRAEEYFCHLWRDWGKLLLGFLVGDREAERWWVVFCGDNVVGEVGSGSLSESGEAFFNSNKSRKVVFTAGDGGVVGRGGQFVRQVNQHLVMR